jgi:hypothetical protein
MRLNFQWYYVGFVLLSIIIVILLILMLLFHLSFNGGNFSVGIAVIALGISLLSIYISHRLNCLNHIDGTFLILNKMVVDKPQIVEKGHPKYTNERREAYAIMVWNYVETMYKRGDISVDYMQPAIDSYLKDFVDVYKDNEKHYDKGLTRYIRKNFPHYFNELV